MRTLNLVSNTGTSSWNEMYNLPEEFDHCPRCGIKRIANIPFFTNGFRGLTSEDHGCGESYKLRVFRPTKEEEKKWSFLGR